MVDINRNKFKCIECNEERIFSYFADKDNLDKLISTCYYCQTGTKPIVRNYRKDPFDYERKCIRCRVIRHQDDFIWVSKNGNRTKEVKTCNICRDSDKELRLKHKQKRKEKAPEPIEEKEKVEPTIIKRRLKKDK